MCRSKVVLKASMLSYGLPSSTSENYRVTASWSTAQTRYFSSVKQECRSAGVFCYIDGHLLERKNVIHHWPSFTRFLSIETLFIDVHFENIWPHPFKIFSILSHPCSLFFSQPFFFLFYFFRTFFFRFLHFMFQRLKKSKKCCCCYSGPQVRKSSPKFLEIMI